METTIVDTRVVSSGTSQMIAAINQNDARFLMVMCKVIEKNSLVKVILKNNVQI